MSTWERTLPRTAGRRPRGGLIAIFIALFLVIIGARTIASYTIEYEWWKELGQVDTWTSIILYGFAPVAAAGVLVFIVLWIAHARGLKRAGTGLGEHPIYAKLSTLAILFVSFVIASAAVDAWTVVRFFGARAANDTSTWQDPVFGNPLRFYIFGLPFWNDLVSLLLILAAGAVIVNWLTARAWSLRNAIPRMREEGGIQMNIEVLSDVFDARFARFALVAFLLALAANLFLGRYDMLFNDHGFMVGVDYTDEHIRLPLQWLAIASCIAGAVFVVLRRWILLGIVVLAFIVKAVVPGIVAGVYVRPNELSLERPYIERHIQATRAAFALDHRFTEAQYPAQLDATVNVAEHHELFENVRLWDWRAFHDTVTQIQSLRQYYVFPDTDVDRYTLNGEMRQVMIAPREIDVRQIGGTSSSWINQHLIYTHGYGLVMASASRITPEGQPLLFIQDAPPKVNIPGLRLTRPELYFGERTHEPVFVRTSQPEFNYPAGESTVQTKYNGRAGIPVSSPLTRLAAALSRGDWNILLTSYLTGDSRMVIRRNVRDRLQAIASFLEWDPDAYLVVTNEGRLVWMVDGYTSSAAHPYSRALTIEGMGSVNYMRNSVKATIDAYDGTTNFYVFDPNDPIIRAWQAIFPKLFKPADAMPQDLRAHARYPELLFRAQSEMYGTYHMRDPEAFYNKEDLWELSRDSRGQTGGSQSNPVQPTFVIATLPGESRSEFLLITSFTPRGKDNMIGLMAARCDGPHLGEMVVLQLSKQALIYGPLQIESRIDSDQNISKDLSLWNQQGSSVIRGQLLVLPIENTFIYVEPIYIQGQQARMPQLKKVVLAIGNRLIYRDTYEQALAELAGSTAQVETPVSTAIPAPQPAAAGARAAPAAPAQGADARIQAIRDHLRRYRELSAQGRWAEAGKELEAVENAVK